MVLKVLLSTSLVLSPQSSMVPLSSINNARIVEFGDKGQRHCKINQNCQYNRYLVAICHNERPFYMYKDTFCRIKEVKWTKWTYLRIINCHFLEVPKKLLLLPVCNKSFIRSQLLHSFCSHRSDLSLNDASKLSYNNQVHQQIYSTMHAILVYFPFVYCYQNAF